MTDDFAMPKINGRNIANNNRLRDSQSNGDKNALGRGKNKNKNASVDAEHDYGPIGFASMGSQLINNGQGVMLRQQMDQRLQMKKNGLGEKLNLFSNQGGSFNMRSQMNPAGGNAVNALRSGANNIGSTSKFGKGPFGSEQPAANNSMSPGGFDKGPQRHNYGGIGRMVLFDEDAPIHKAERRKKRFQFDPSEGRDYAADAPQDERHQRF